MNFLSTWYNTWEDAISERLDPSPSWATWDPDFFEYINDGWLSMYYEPLTQREIQESWTRPPYYNDEYYEV